MAFSSCFFYGGRASSLSAANALRLALARNSATPLRVKRMCGPQIDTVCPTE